MAIKFIQNLTETTLVCGSVGISVPPKSVAQITGGQADHDEVSYAVIRGWAKVTDTEPEPIEYDAPKMVLADAFEGSQTQAEVEAEAKTETKTRAKKPTTSATE